MPPPGIGCGRFDLPQQAVAYFGESAETALFETLARRQARWLARDDLARRSLLTVTTTASLRLIDLRHHAHSFPVLQSLRHSETQKLAGDVLRAGYEGIVCRSAQQHGADCFALFGPVLKHIRQLHKLALIEPTSGSFHGAVVNAVRGACLPVV